MNIFLFEKKQFRLCRLLRSLWFLIALLVLLSVPVAALEQQPKGLAFDSPEQAVKALSESVRTGDTNKILSVLGEDARDIVFSGDQVESAGELSNFVNSFSDKHEIETVTPTTAQLIIGKDNWVFPIPLVKIDKGWYFDVAAGRDELLNRRIGSNEISVIQVMMDYVNAQYEYASKDRNGDGIREYAQKINSDPGKKNGLYWPVAAGEPKSPFGPFIARAALDGYSSKTDTDKSKPYNGYYYKIITRQGENAPGGAYDYVVDGKMILGFGLLAYPAKYGVSGIMTFAVNQEGVVYESDLGEKTSEIINQTVKYNPEDHSWHKVDKKYLD